MEAVTCESIEIVHRGIQPETGCRLRIVGYNFFHHGNVPVIDMGIGNHMQKFSRLKAGNLSKHHGENCILHDIPVVGSEHILRTLVQDGVELPATDIECHGIGAGIKSHLTEIRKIINVGHDSAGGGIVFQVPDDFVNLIHISLRIMVFDTKLITVCFADRTRLVCPGIPDAGTKIMHIIALCLPDPEKLIDGGFPKGPADGENREFFCKIVPVDNPEAFDGVSRRAVFPTRTDRQICIPYTVIENITTILNKYLVSSAHNSLLKQNLIYSTTSGGDWQLFSYPLDEAGSIDYNAGRDKNRNVKRERRRTMKKLCALMIAVLLLAGIPLAAWAEKSEEPAVILLDETEEAENGTEENAEEEAKLPGKTVNNYNHKVLLDDDKCTISVADASFSPEQGWAVTVKCENKSEQPLDFSWANMVSLSGEEETVWTEEITVGPEAWKQLSFSTSEITEAERLEMNFSVSETELEEETDGQPEEPLQEDKEEDPASAPEEAREEEEEKYQAQAAAVMKNANGNTYVLDDAASPIVVDFEALAERNSDVCGWLYCPNTVISYPVVQAEDNSFYLHRDIDLNYSSYGTLFTEAMSAKDFDNDNSIIYGHHMKDGGMFAGLVNYGKMNYYEKHPVFYLNTPEMNYRVEVFAAFLTDMYSDAYNNSFDSDEEMQAWLDAARELSAIKTDVEVQPGDRVLTLSTCTYEYDTARYVVMGKMVPIR